MHTGILSNARQAIGNLTEDVSIARYDLSTTLREVRDAAGWVKTLAICGCIVLAGAMVLNLIDQLAHE